MMPTLALFVWTFKDIVEASALGLFILLLMVIGILFGIDYLVGKWKSWIFKRKKGNKL